MLGRYYHVPKHLSKDTKRSKILCTCLACLYLRVICVVECYVPIKNINAPNAYNYVWGVPNVPLIWILTWEALQGVQVLLQIEGGGRHGAEGANVKVFSPSSFSVAVYFAVPALAPLLNYVTTQGFDYGANTECGIMRLGH